jgi:ferritin-like metal-binding protein YciE
MAETSAAVVIRYLQNAVAAEKALESQLTAFADHQSDDVLKQLFRQRALETKSHHEKLSRRLAALGSTPSNPKNLLAHIFGLGSRSATIAHTDRKHTAPDLITAFAIEHSEVAMYEAFAAIAEAASDIDTADLVRSIQHEARAAAERLWQLLPAAAIRSFGLQS